MKSMKNSKSGFTIIEVVLVLAIAGLIFLMVFIALPALQRSQRDTQRRDDLAMMSTALNNYSTNNRGQVPTTAAKWVVFWTDYLKSNAYTNATSNSIVNTQPSDTSEFFDPLGYNYVFVYDDSTDTWDWSSTAQSTGTPDTSKGFVIHIFSSSSCNGEAIETDAGSRSVAFKYRLEGSGYYCGDNK